MGPTPYILQIISHFANGKYILIFVKYCDRIQKMMKKNIFIIGVPRSGKSTLANIVCDRFGFSLVSIDAIVATFYNVFPELGMHAEPEKSEPIVSKFIFEYMRQLSTESPNRKFVIEGCHIQPATVVANTDCEKYDVVCMGYPGLTPEQFLLRVRGTNWAVAKNDAEIIQMGECFIARSRQYQETCKQHNIKFIDTSGGILTALGDYMK